MGDDETVSTAVLYYNGYMADFAPTPFAEKDQITRAAFAEADLFACRSLGT